jgi:hypothetical protein
MPAYDVAMNVGQALPPAWKRAAVVRCICTYMMTTTTVSTPSSALSRVNFMVADGGPGPEHVESGGLSGTRLLDRVRRQRREQVVRRGAVPEQAPLDGPRKHAQFACSEARRGVAGRRRRNLWDSYFLET